MYTLYNTLTVYGAIIWMSITAALAKGAQLSSFKKRDILITTYASTRPCIRSREMKQEFNYVMKGYSMNDLITGRTRCVPFIRHNRAM